MITPNSREYRSFELEQSQELRATGTPVVFDTPTLIAQIDGVDYFEIIDSHAFDGTDMSDVVLNVNHQGRAAAKTRNKTLNLFIRDKDVYMDADLSKNQTGRELHEDISNGFFEKMSFAFTVLKDKFDKATRTRTILQIDKLYDVSAVDRPAYEATSISARSFFEAEVEKEMKEHAEAVQRELKLEKLKALLGENPKGDQ